MKQEVRIQIDISITLDAKHDDRAVRDIVERGARNLYPNNYGHLHSLRYAEERHIYGPGEIEWQPIVTRVAP